MRQLIDDRRSTADIYKKTYHRPPSVGWIYTVSISESNDQQQADIMIMSVYHTLFIVNHKSFRWQWLVRRSARGRLTCSSRRQPAIRKSKRFATRHKRRLYYSDYWALIDITPHGWLCYVRHLWCCLCHGPIRCGKLSRWNSIELSVWKCDNICISLFNADSLLA